MYISVSFACLGKSVEGKSADPRMFVCVYGQGFYFGQAPVNDIKSACGSYSCKDRKERGLFIRREKAAD